MAYPYLDGRLSISSFVHCLVPVADVAQVKKQARNGVQATLRYRLVALYSPQTPTTAHIT